MPIERTQKLERQVPQLGPVDHLHPDANPRAARMHSQPALYQAGSGLPLGEQSADIKDLPFQPLLHDIGGPVEAEVGRFGGADLQPPDIVGRPEALHP